MSLNFNLSRIESWQELFTESGAPKPQTEALIFLTIIIGMGEITSKNATEFAARVHLFETCNGPLLVGPEGGIPITLSDIQRHIGLRTNASPLTRTKFINAQIWPEILTKVSNIRGAG